MGTESETNSKITPHCDSKTITDINPAITDLINIILKDKIYINIIQLPLKRDSIT